MNPLWGEHRSERGLDSQAWRWIHSKWDKLEFTWALDWVLLLAVAVTADVIEGEQEVVLLMQLGGQLYLYLERGHQHGLSNVLLVND